MGEDQPLPPGGPAFLKPEVAEKLDYPGDPSASTLFDHELTIEELPALSGDIEPMGKGPSEGYRIRHDRIAYLHALGYSNNQIGKHLGYSPTGISLALQKPWVLERVEHHRSALFDPEVANRIKMFAQDAVGYLHGTIHDPTVKDEIKSANARWGVEKYSGKPKQEVHHESHTFSAYMDLLKGMQTRGEVFDVTPQSGGQAQIPAPDKQEDPWDSWLNANMG